MPAEVKMYTTRLCPYCMRARKLLDMRNVAYSDIGVDGNSNLRRQMMDLSGRHTVPQIWIGDQHIGGFDELNLLERQGRLDKLLNAA